MNQTGNEYAEALFSLAGERNKIEAIEKDLSLVLSLFAENPEYSVFLSSPGISKEDRLSALNEAFGSFVEEETSAFLAVMCEKGRIKELPEAANLYMDMCRSAKNVAVAKVTSAVALTEEEKSRLKKQLEKKTGKTVRLEFSEDKSLIGGLSVEIDGKIIDGSVKHKLAEIKEVIDR